MNELRDRRQQWFHIYKERLDRIVRQFAKEGGGFTCPCCGYPPLFERGGYEICSLCCWEDDGQDDPRAEEIFGGPNSDYSLSEAHENFRKHLTMYRPTDQPAFEIALQKLAIKHELISVYEQMLKSYGSYNFRYEFERLKRETERLTDKLRSTGQFAEWKRD